MTTLGLSLWRFAMRNLVERYGWIVVLVAFAICGNVAEYQFRKAAQNNETLYDVMLAYDGFNFSQNGGGSFGYANNYKYEYAKWRASPDRTLVQRLTLWDRGIMYDASSPPAQYAYPPKFKQN